MLGRAEMEHGRPGYIGAKYVETREMCLWTGAMWDPVALKE